MTDIRALRALAHPDRVAILRLLMAGVARTATECARAVGASPSACSYHLRELERFGFVVRDESVAGDGRTRPWKAAAVGFSLGTAAERRAGIRSGRVRRAARGGSRGERPDGSAVRRARGLSSPTEWQDAAEFATFELALTAAEFRELTTSGGRPAASVPRRRPEGDACPGSRRATCPRGRPGLPTGRCRMTDLEITERAPPVWRSRDFRLAWAAGFVNDTGDWVLMVALPVYVFSRDGLGHDDGPLVPLPASRRGRARADRRQPRRPVGSAPLPDRHQPRAGRHAGAPAGGDAVADVAGLRGDRRAGGAVTAQQPGQRRPAAAARRRRAADQCQRRALGQPQHGPADRLSTRRPRRRRRWAGAGRARRCRQLPRRGSRGGVHHRRHPSGRRARGCRPYGRAGRAAGRCRQSAPRVGADHPRHRPDRAGRLRGALRRVRDRGRRR